MTENKDGADKTQPKTDTRVRPAVKSAKVEDSRTIEDRIILLARMYANKPSNKWYMILSRRSKMSPG